jgi:hypothetical protein
MKIEVNKKQIDSLRVIVEDGIDALSSQLYCPLNIEMSNNLKSVLKKIDFAKNLDKKLNEVLYD